MRARSTRTWLWVAMCLTATPAAEAARVNRNVEATGVYQLFFAAERNTTYTFETTNLSAGADTVMHLWNVRTGAEVAYDDDGGAGLASRIVYRYPNTDGAVLVLYVRAYSASSMGQANLLRDGAIAAAAIPVRGTRVSVPCGTNITYETALAPNGTNDTLLLGLTTSGRLRGVDNDGGVGRASRLVGRPDICQLVVAANSLADEGPTHVYANDTAIDEDGDGLGADLESDLGTCDSKGQKGCDAIYDPADTDRDGLTDMAEIFGVDDFAFPQHLAKWGANPLHKDVFIEVDYRDVFASNPLTAQDLVTAQSFFDIGPASSLQNPDGLDGVSLHFDIGRAPTNPAHATLYGDWDCQYGSNCGSSSVPAGPDYAVAADTHRRPVRARVFHYALMDEAEGGGQAWPAGDRLGWGGTVRNRRIDGFVHELGHNLNLGHHGHWSWGAVNCKPNYNSIMNYAYPTSVGFSTSANNWDLDPSAVSEQYAMGTWSNPSYLAGSPFHFGVSGTMVDWNRDQLLPSMDPIRTGITWATWQSCTALDKNAYTLLDEAPYASTPVMTRRNDRLYVFWVGADNRIKYRHGRVSGLDHNGSCPGGDDLGETCMTFSEVLEVPTVEDAKSVSAVTWQDSTVVIAFQTARYDSVRVKSASTVTRSGALIGWNNESWVTGAHTTAEPELGIIDVDPARFGGNAQVLALAFTHRTASAYQLAWAASPTSGWTMTTMRDGAGLPIVGALSPSFAKMPAPRADPTCAALSDASSHVRVHCYDASADRWLDVTSQAFGTMSPPLSTGKPGFAYHVQRHWNGRPIAGDESRGQFRLTIVKVAGFPDIYVSSTLDYTKPPLTDLSFQWLGKVGNVWTDIVDGTGVVLFEDPGLSALKGLWVRNAGASGPRIEFLPLADGSFGATLKDGDDFAVMERGICMGLVPQAEEDAVCGSAATTVSNL